jgi:hypothetical protein
MLCAGFCRFHWRFDGSFPRHQGHVKLDRLLLVLCLVLHALLLLVGPWFPTTDGASHLYNAQLMLDFDQHREWLQWNHWFLPQWLVPLLLAAKVKLLGAELGYRFHLLFISWSAAAAFWFLSPKPNRTLATTGSLLVSLSYPFAMGFFSYCLGMSGSVALGLWAWRFRSWKALTAQHSLLLTFCTTALYFVHLVPWLVSILVLLAIPGHRWKKLLAVGPGLILLAIYFTNAQRLDYIQAGGAQPWSNWWAAATFFPFLPLSSEVHYQWLRHATGAWFGLLIVFGIWFRFWFRKPLDLRDSALLAALITVLAAPLLPDGGLGGSVLQSRIAHYAPIFLIFWAAIVDWTERQRRTLTVLAALITIWMYGNRLNLATWLEPVHQEVLSANQWIPRGSQAVALDVGALGFDYQDRERSLWIRPLAHFDGVMASQAGCFNFYNYEAASGVFPLRFRPDKNPDQALFNGHALPDPPMIHLDKFAARFGLPVEYVALINYQGVNWNHPHLRQVSQQLETYRVIGANRMVQVWKIRSK